MKINRKAFGKRMQFARQIRGHTQVSLAMATGVSLNAIAAYENGRNLPGLESFVSICKELDFPLSYFMEYERETVDENISCY